MKQLQWVIMNINLNSVKCLAVKLHCNCGVEELSGVKDLVHKKIKNLWVASIRFRFWDFWGFLLFLEFILVGFLLFCFIFTHALLRKEQTILN